MRLWKAKVTGLVLLVASGISACGGNVHQEAQCEPGQSYVGPPTWQPEPSALSMPATDRDWLALEAPDAIQAHLQAALAEARDLAGAEAVTAALIHPDWRWQASLGASSELDPAPFYWASIGKLMTAQVILQMAQEGALDLDNTLDRWFPELPEADKMTVRHLLTHTSGLFSYNEDLQYRSQQEDEGPEANLDIALAHPLLFCPGTQWRYSNTNYLLLGLLIERIDQEPYAASVERRLFAHSTLRVATSGNSSDVIYALADPSQRAFFPFAPHWPYAAGSVVGSAEAMAAYWLDTLRGERLPTEIVLAQYAQLYPMFDEHTWYGLGVMAYTPTDNTTWLGHSGGTREMSAVLLWMPEHELVVAVSHTGTESRAEAIAHRLVSRLEEIE